ncbi:MAG: hypothetical protein HY650_08845 [Acidobacteria bacterium]|nr:hypothetical protein [Acidobacteriota bacterium]
MSFWLIHPGAIRAEKLPIRTYTTRDGLAQNAVNKIVRDSRGFLWFCTEEGLSRYDGYAFTNYSVEHGLPNRRVTDLVETREGEYWIATGGGLCLFNPKGSSVQTADSIRRPRPATRDASEPLFTVFYPGDDQKVRFITVLLQDRAGTLWCGTQRGLFRLERNGDQIRLAAVDIGLPFDLLEGGEINALCEDDHGTLWIGSASGLYRRWIDGHTARYSDRDGLPSGGFSSLLSSRRGEVWAGTMQYGLFRLSCDSAHEPPKVVRHYASKDGLGSDWIWALLESSDGRLRVATNLTVCEFLPSSAPRDPTFRAYPRSKGVGTYEVLSLTEDQDGNLWMGTNTAGAMKLTHSGFTTFEEDDGITNIHSIFEDNRGELCLVGFVPADRSSGVDQGPRTGPTELANSHLWARLGRWDGPGFTWVRPGGPNSIGWYFGWGWNQIVLQDHAGEWWIPASTKWGELCRFPKLDRFEDLQSTRPKAVYSTKDGLATTDLFRIFEDSLGDIWISCAGAPEGGLARWERATATVRDMSRTDGLPSLKGRTATSFRDDRAGNLWIGFSWDGLARYRNGRFDYFTTRDGVPAGWIYDLYVDRGGKLWVASTLGGLALVDDPTVDRPVFTTYTTAQGLSSNKVTCITEDRWGRIYVGTSRGLDRFDPAAGRVKHFTAADGLTSGEIRVLFVDRKGTIWAGGAAGLSRYVPQPDSPHSPPPIFIHGMSIRGVRQPVSALGEVEISLPDLAPDMNQLQIDFTGLSFASGESLRYQFRLEGADTDWGTPTDQRTVNFANLAPGTYRFLVRAVNSEGIASPRPAAVMFAILRPTWQRWWFLTLAALLAGLVAYTLYRHRIVRVLELERVRVRISTDLHDDIGSSLSRIAILSEVVKRQDDSRQAQSAEMLTQIAETSRGLVDTMSDIVWSIDPRRDDLNNLILRISEFAADVLDAKGIAWTFDAPTDPETVRLTPDQRRHLFLIFKEALNNIARHAEASSVRLAITVRDRRLLVEIEDDGRGLRTASTPAAEPPRNRGHGLDNMRARAAEIGGALAIEANAGRGTRLTLSVPLK